MYESARYTMMDRPKEEVKTIFPPVSMETQSHGHSQDITRSSSVKGYLGVARCGVDWVRGSLLGLLRQPTDDARQSVTLATHGQTDCPLPQRVMTPGIQNTGMPRRREKVYRRSARTLVCPYGKG